MSTSSVVRAALVGAALLACAACTGGDADEKESAASTGSDASSSGPTTSSAPSTSAEPTSPESMESSGSANPSEKAAEPSSSVPTSDPEEEEATERPVPPSNWAETEKQVQAKAAGTEEGIPDASQENRALVSTLSSAGSSSTRVPQGVDGVVVTCGGEGTGRLVMGADDSVMFGCGAIVDSPLASAEREITIEVADGAHWTLAFYTVDATST